MTIYKYTTKNITIYRLRKTTHCRCTRHPINSMLKRTNVTYTHQKHHTDNTTYILTSNNWHYTVQCSSIFKIGKMTLLISISIFKQYIYLFEYHRGIIHEQTCDINVIPWQFRYIYHHKHSIYMLAWSTMYAYRTRNPVLIIAVLFLT